MRAQGTGHRAQGGKMRDVRCERREGSVETKRLRYIKLCNLHVKEKRI